MHEKEKMMKALVVDGYNAIYRIPYLRKMADSNLAAARTEITKLAKEYMRKRGGIDRLHVIFDGKDAHRNAGYPVPPEQIFSGTGKGDEEIVSVVRRLRSRYQVEVVTCDNYVRNNSRAYKAAVLDVSEFISVAKKTFRREASIEQKADKVTLSGAFKINEELRKEWNL